MWLGARVQAYSSVFAPGPTTGRTPRRPMRRRQEAADWCRGTGKRAACSSRPTAPASQPASASPTRAPSPFTAGWSCPSRRPRPLSFRLCSLPCSPRTLLILHQSSTCPGQPDRRAQSPVVDVLDLSQPRLSRLPTKFVLCVNPSAPPVSTHPPFAPSAKLRRDPGPVDTTTRPPFVSTIAHQHRPSVEHALALRSLLLTPHAHPIT